MMKQYVFEVIEEAAKQRSRPNPHQSEQRSAGQDRAPRRHDPRGVGHRGREVLRERGQPDRAPQPLGVDPEPAHGLRRVAHVVGDQRQDPADARQGPLGVLLQGLRRRVQGRLRGLPRVPGVVRGVVLQDVEGHRRRRLEGVGEVREGRGGPRGDGGLRLGQRHDVLEGLLRHEPLAERDAVPRLRLRRGHRQGVRLPRRQGPRGRLPAAHVPPPRVGGALGRDGPGSLEGGEPLLNSREVGWCDCAALVSRDLPPRERQHERLTDI